MSAPGKVDQDVNPCLLDHIYLPFWHLPPNKGTFRVLVRPGAVYCAKLRHIRAARWHSAGQLDSEAHTPANSQGGDTSGGSEIMQMGPTSNVSKSALFIGLGPLGRRMQQRLFIERRRATQLHVRGLMWPHLAIQHIRCEVPRLETTPILTSNRLTLDSSLLAYHGLYAHFQLQQCSS